MTKKRGDPPVRVAPSDRRLFLQQLGAAGLVLQGSLWGLPLACKRAEDTGQDQVFYFAVITDPHIQADPEHNNNKHLATTIQILNDFEVPLDFVVLTGDLVDELPSDDPAYYDEHDDSELHRLKEILAQAAMPCHLVMGNHDYYIDQDDMENHVTADVAAREALFQQLLDMPGPWHRFDSQGIAFYCLNTMQQDDEASWSPGSCGSFGQEQLAWLEEQLSDGMSAFLFFHHPLALDNAVEAGLTMLFPFEVPRAEGDYDKYEGSEYEDWTDPIYALLQERASQVLAVFVGHGHYFVEDHYQGIPVMMTDSVGNSYQASSIGEDEQPMRYHIVQVNLSQGSFSIYNRSWFVYNA